MPSNAGELSGKERLEKELSFIGIPTQLAQSIIGNEIKIISTKEEEPHLFVLLEQDNGNWISIKRTTYSRLDPKTFQELKKCFNFEVYSVVSYLAGIRPKRFCTL